MPWLVTWKKPTHSKAALATARHVDSRQLVTNKPLPSAMSSIRREQAHLLLPIRYPRGSNRDRINTAPVCEPSAPKKISAVTAAGFKEETVQLEHQSHFQTNP
jgi:hypothetical protein